MSRKLSPIHQAEFDADCLAARERAFDLIAERYGAERANVLRWMGRSAPRSKPFGYVPKQRPKPVRRLTIVEATGRKAQRGQRYSYAGKSLTQSQWAERLGISLNTLHQRAHRLGNVIDAIALGGLQIPGRRPGAVKNFPALPGTGGGCRPQDIPQIEIFPNDRTD